MKEENWKWLLRLWLFLVEFQRWMAPHQSSVACFATERIPLLLSLKCLATHVFGLLGDDSWSYVMKMFGFVLVWFLVFLSFSRSPVSTPVGSFRVIFVFYGFYFRFLSYFIYLLKDQYLPHD